MNIRVKLTLWYACMLFASLILCGALLYHEWVIEPKRAHRHHAEEEEDGLTDLLQDVLLCAIPASVLGLGGGWWLMRRALAPVAELTKAAERVNENNLDVQLPRTGNGDEFDRLTSVFNDMTSRLADSFLRIREFTLRASHELKTPLTIMRGELEIALNNPEMSVDQRENLLNELDEIDRLTKIVDGLTLLTKADAGLVALKQEPVRLDELMRDIFADGQILARPCEVDIRLKACEQTTIIGDNYRLRQVFLNLVDNALKYNQVGGSVIISLEQAGAFAEVTITNTGPGVPPELMGRVFDPFYRVDAAHSRAVDGCGLGLAIARWIVTAHGGTITLTSQPGEVTTAMVRVPLVKDIRGDYQTMQPHPCEKLTPSQPLDAPKIP